MEACSHITTTILPKLKHVLFATGILNISLNIGLCIWFGISNKDLPSILVILLCSSCTLYSVVSFSYLRLLSLSRTLHPHLLGSGILCILIVVSIVILLGVGGANQIPGSLISSAWIALAILSVSTLRIPCRRWWNRDRLLRCSGLSEEDLVMY
ncbi:hypothetical protein B0O99DRAFT_159869 [Bisporella sp. PMI_857]|nr:hypothetical protein B0O99DRAFT_159869 [Bisporella sp. PMI_857]